MPSWPTRLFLGSATSNHSHNPEEPWNGGNQGDRLRAATQPTTPFSGPPYPTSNNAYGVPITRRASRHGRSISHPFPSIFGSAKKQNAREDDEEIVVDAKTLHTGSPASHVVDQPGFSRLTTAHLEDVELISGRCATCDSQVRWPKHLDVFRCTVCLMINDHNAHFPRLAADVGLRDEPSGRSRPKAHSRPSARSKSIFED